MNKGEIMATNILSFSLNRCTRIESIDESHLKSVCSLTDTMIQAEVSLVVLMPDLAIESANGFFHHVWQDEIKDLDGLLKRLEGVRIGSGMLKIIRGLIGDEPGLRPLITLIEECCQGVILSLTKPILSKAPLDEDQKNDFYSRLVKKNIRLYDRCAAFGRGTPLVKASEASLAPEDS